MRFLELVMVQSGREFVREKNRLGEGGLNSRLLEAVCRGNNLGTLTILYQSVPIGDGRRQQTNMAVPWILKDAYAGPEDGPQVE